ncbi:hypothetical protein DPMN_055615 [Dreissena polymorpha]|uniref:Uncharacterized protein n=1 Tax=Dreissena polymorpha TaxID=45954 RepID=A0A9D4HSV1_DREPO|nr:hypothetical protein DPMN_055615 [Dreissena polymorpha]
MAPDTKVPDGRTDGKTEGRTDGQHQNNIPPPMAVDNKWCMRPIAMLEPVLAFAVLLVNHALGAELFLNPGMEQPDMVGTWGNAWGYKVDRINTDSHTVPKVNYDPHFIEVEVALRSHEFGFGSVIDDAAYLDPGYVTYQNLLHEFFNWATVGTYKWGYNQGTPVSEGTTGKRRGATMECRERLNVGNVGNASKLGTTRERRLVVVQPGNAGT